MISKNTNTIDYTMKKTLYDNCALTQKKSSKSSFNSNFPNEIRKNEERNIISKFKDDNDAHLTNQQIINTITNDFVKTRKNSSSMTENDFWNSNFLCESNKCSSAHCNNDYNYQSYNSKYLSDNDNNIYIDNNYRNSNNSSGKYDFNFHNSQSNETKSSQFKEDISNKEKLFNFFYELKTLIKEKKFLEAYRVTEKNYSLLYTTDTKLSFPIDKHLIKLALLEVVETNSESEFYKLLKILYPILSLKNFGYCKYEAFKKTIHFPFFFQSNYFKNTISYFCQESLERLLDFEIEKTQHTFGLSVENSSTGKETNNFFYCSKFYDFDYNEKIKLPYNEEMKDVVEKNLYLSNLIVEVAYIITKFINSASCNNNFSQFIKKEYQLINFYDCVDSSNFKSIINDFNSLNILSISEITYKACRTAFREMKKIENNNNNNNKRNTPNNEELALNELKEKEYINNISINLGINSLAPINFNNAKIDSKVKYSNRNNNIQLTNKFPELKMTYSAESQNAIDYYESDIDNYANKINNIDNKEKKYNSYSNMNTSLNEFIRMKRRSNKTINMFSDSIECYDSFYKYNNTSNNSAEYDRSYPLFDLLNEENEYKECETDYFCDNNNQYKEITMNAESDFSNTINSNIRANDIIVINDNLTNNANNDSSNSNNSNTYFANNTLIKKRNSNTIIKITAPHKLIRKPIKKNIKRREKFNYIYEVVPLPETSLIDNTLNTKDNECSSSNANESNNNKNNSNININFFVPSLPSESVYETASNINSSNSSTNPISANSKALISNSSTTMSSIDTNNIASSKKPIFRVVPYNEWVHLYPIFDVIYYFRNKNANIHNSSHELKINKNFKLSSLKVFSFKNIKRENIDKKVLRKFRGYLETKFTRNDPTVKITASIFEDEFARLFLLKEAYPPFKTKDNKIFKSFSTSYMIWFFSHEIMIRYYEEFMCYNLENLTDYISRTFTLVDDKESQLLHDYIKQIANLYSDFHFNIDPYQRINSGNEIEKEINNNNYSIENNCLDLINSNNCCNPTNNYNIDSKENNIAKTEYLENSFNSIKS